MIVEHVNNEISNHTKDLDICAKIVADIVHQSHVISSAREDLKLLFKSKDLFRTVIQAVIKMDRSNKLAVSMT